MRSIDWKNGDVNNHKSLIDAMIATDMTQDPRGPVKLDPKFHAAIENVYIREVATDASGKLFNKGVWTVKEVSQFGPYKPDTYMAEKPDSNAFPPDKCSSASPAMLKADAEYKFEPFGK